MVRFSSGTLIFDSMSDVSGLELFEDYYAWLREMASHRRFSNEDRRGTANLIDHAARLRAAESIKTGVTYSLCRPLVEGANMRGDGLPAFSLERFLGTHDDLSLGSDHLELDSHGHEFTHIDALNHIGMDGTWYGGHPLDQPGGPSVADLAVEGLVTRGLFVDIPAARGVDWVSPDEPVSGLDFDVALEASGVEFRPGDALLVYMGREKYQAAGHPYYERYRHEKRPGIGRNGAQWIVEHGVSALGWDFSDANHPSEPVLSVHRLVWAIGLVLVDNCDFSRAIQLLRDNGTSAGLFCVAPLPLVGATGCNVNPMLLT
jgi:kynurenine formamidase